MDHPITRVERAAAAVDPVLRSVRPDQLSLPTPCQGWDLRTLLDHFLGGLHRWGRRLGGGDAEAPTPTLAESGDAVAPAWEQARDALLQGLRTPGAVEQAGPLLTIIPVELLAHGWDTARAIGAPADFDPELATELLAEVRPLMEKFGRGTGFAEEQPAPPGCSAADRLAAFSGRAVG